MFRDWPSLTSSPSDEEHMTMTRLLTAGALATVAFLLLIGAGASRAEACALSPTDPDCNAYARAAYNAFNTVNDTAGAPCHDLECDPPPTNPYCDMYDSQPGRTCVTVKKDFQFQAVDTERPEGNNHCTVTLEGSAPEDQTDPENRPDVQYRSTLKCDKPLQVVDIKPSLYTATGGYIASATPFHCHALAGGCPTTATAGSRGLRPGPADYRQTTYVRLVLPGGPDPWVLAEGRPGNGAESCAPNYQKGYVVECLLDLDIPATPPQTN